MTEQHPNFRPSEQPRTPYHHPYPAPDLRVPPPPPPPQPPKKKHTVRTVVLAVLAVLAVVVVGSIIGSMNGANSGAPEPAAVGQGSPGTPKPNDSGKTGAEKSKAPAEKPKETASAEAPESEEAEPEVTKGQEQALLKAESYLDLSAFSKKGLIKQLEYEGFSKADAEWAVDHVDVDWNEQAVKKALSYLELSAFSESELADQLEYEGFTAKQAKHGASEAYKR